MSITLYCPNLGADGVTHEVYATFKRYAATRIPELKIEVLPGDTKNREKDAGKMKLASEANLFMVERLRMPNPNSEGKSVVVYRTTVRITGLKMYAASCYTSVTEDISIGIIDLTPDELMRIGEHVGKTSTLGLWESLLQVERLGRFRFY